MLPETRLVLIVLSLKLINVLSLKSVRFVTGVQNIACTKTETRAFFFFWSKEDRLWTDVRTRQGQGQDSNRIV